MNGIDVPGFVDCLTEDNGEDCGCADMTFDDQTDMDDIPWFVQSLLELDSEYTTSIGPISATITTDAGDQAATIQGEIRISAGPPDADGVLALTLDELILGTSSVPTLGGETGGMSFLIQPGSGTGTWDLQTGQFSLVGDFDGGYQLADEETDDPPPAGSDTEEDAREFWGGILDRNSGIGTGRPIGRTRRRTDGRCHQFDYGACHASTCAD